MRNETERERVHTACAAGVGYWYSKSTTEQKRGVGTMLRWKRQGSVSNSYTHISIQLSAMPPLELALPSPLETLLLPPPVLEFLSLPETLLLPPLARCCGRGWRLDTPGGWIQLSSSFPLFPPISVKVSAHNPNVTTLCGLAAETVPAGSVHRRIRCAANSSPHGLSTPHVDCRRGCCRRQALHSGYICKAGALVVAAIAGDMTPGFVCKREVRPQKRGCGHTSRLLPIRPLV
jgi:hypothetical protein